MPTPQNRSHAVMAQRHEAADSVDDFPTPPWATRARGRKGGRPFKMTPAKLRLAQASMGKPETVVADLCVEIGITRQTLYRFVDPKGQLRAAGERLLNRQGKTA